MSNDDVTPLTTGAGVQEGNEAFRAFMDKLTKSNVDEYVDLPTIAVMGDTSSGKSSLLSMISQIELPSNDKLTTRCPIMLQMHKKDKVSARVRVSWKDKPERRGVDFEEKEASEANWTQLTRYIAEAQEHIITMQNKEVARDIVSVEINGPNCENLTLIDLPGIVRSHGKGESATLSEDIQSLLGDYLRNNRCVILAVLPANVDFHNSQIMAEALKVDPDTMRTIPVLTKPDLIDAGAEESVKELLLGKKTDTFKMGFHMVKGRGQKALDGNTSIEEGLDQESRFFQNTEPWRNVDDKSLFGTKNLRVKLGELQMRLIRSSFDEIVSEMKEKRQAAFAAKVELGSIPSGLVEKIALFRTVTDEYCNTIGALMKGTYVGKMKTASKVKASAAFHSASTKFKDELGETRLARISDLAVGVDVFALVDEVEVSGTICFMLEQHVCIPSCIEEANTTFKLPSTEKTIFSCGDVYHRADDGSVVRLKPIPKDKVRRDPKWIVALLQENRLLTPLPIFLNTEVFVAIVSDLIQEGWPAPSLRLLEHTADVMATEVKYYIKKIQSIQSLRFLRDFLARRSAEVLEVLTEKARDEILDFMSRECVPYTQNEYLVETISKSRSKRLMEQLSVMVGESGTIHRADVQKILQIVFERNQSRSMDDHMAEEMQNALDAYSKVALKTVADEVPKICRAIMLSYSDLLKKAFFEVLDTEIDRLVVAPMDIVAKMQMLERKLKTLDEGIAAIKQL